MKSAVLFGLCLALAVPSASAQTPAPVRPGQGVLPPRILKEVKATYPPEAMKARLEGIVRLECVVEADGTVGDVRVLEGLDASLDAAAIGALKEWRFAPGTRNGTPVPVLVEVEISFRISYGPKLDSSDVFKPGGDVTTPRVVSDPKPEYPREVMGKRIRGTVVLECVVLTSGRVGEIRVKTPLEPALDAAAKQALQRWQFEPGTKDGKPVSVQVEVEMTFQLQ
jgi:TonB family protein